MNLAGEIIFAAADLLTERGAPFIFTTAYHEPAMTANAATEMRWIDAWNQAYAIAQEQRDVPCQLPDSSVVTLDDCLAWLQSSVYAGYQVRVEAGWVGHRRGIIVDREQILE